MIALTAMFAIHGAAHANEAHLRIIAEQCGIQLKLSDPECICIASSAGQQLTDTQLGLMVAQVTKNSDQLARLQSEATIGDMTVVGNFMTSIVAQCQR